MRNTLLHAFAAAVAVTAAVPAGATSFTNGSLEADAPAFIVSLPGGASAFGWTAGAANIEFVKSGYAYAGDAVGPAYDGEWMVDLNGTQGPSSITQVFDTTPGQWYRVSYALSGNAGPNGTTSGDLAKSLAAYWNGGLVDAASYAHQSGDQWANLRWELHSFVVQATGASSALAFASTSGAYVAAGPLLDGVTIAAVPEPASALLALLGAGVVGLQVRRRRTATSRT
jgi:hypothetical protein